MGQAAKVIYGGECRIPHPHGTHQELLPNAHEQARPEGFRTKGHKPRQGVRLSVRQRAGQMGEDGKTACPEHLF